MKMGLHVGDRVHVPGKYDRLIVSDIHTIHQGDAKRYIVTADFESGHGFVSLPEREFAHGWKGESPNRAGRRTKVRAHGRRGGIHVRAHVRELNRAHHHGRHPYEIVFKKDGGRHRWVQFHVNEESARAHARKTIEHEFGGRASLVSVKRISHDEIGNRAGRHYMGGYVIKITGSPRYSGEYDGGATEKAAIAEARRMKSHIDDSASARVRIVRFVEDKNHPDGRAVTLAEV